MPKQKAKKSLQPPAVPTAQARRSDPPRRDLYDCVFHIAGAPTIHIRTTAVAPTIGQAAQLATARVRAATRNGPAPQLLEVQLCSARMDAD